MHCLAGICPPTVDVSRLHTLNVCLGSGHTRYQCWSQYLLKTSSLKGCFFSGGFPGELPKPRHQFHPKRCFDILPFQLISFLNVNDSSGNFCAYLSPSISVFAINTSKHTTQDNDTPELSLPKTLIPQILLFLSTTTSKL